jgi:hypothetical protein
MQTRIRSTVEVGQYEKGELENICMEFILFPLATLILNVPSSEIRINNLRRVPMMYGTLLLHRDFVL